MYTFEDDGKAEDAISDGAFSADTNPCSKGDESCESEDFVEACFRNN